MKHPLSLNYDRAKDAELLKLLRFHSMSTSQLDPKVVRMLRQAANRIEELIAERDGTSL